MGSFNGHFFSSLPYVVIGLWWTFNQLKRYYQSLLKNGLPYKNSATFKCSCSCRRLTNLELEGFLKIILPIILFFGEMFPGHPIAVRNGHHATIHFFFFVNGLINLLVHYRVSLPKTFNYCSLAMPFFVQGLLFKYHLFGRSDIDVAVHTLVVYTSFLSMALILIEMKFHESLIAGLGRSYFSIVHGTWQSHIGFILYNPFPGAEPWDGTDHKQLMLITLFFTWHMAAVLVIQLSMAGVLAYLYRPRRERQDYRNYKHDPVKVQLLPHAIKGQTEVSE